MSDPTVEDWERLQQIFDQALQKEGEARHQFLDEQCGDDDRLRQQIEELLDAHGEAGEMLEPSGDSGSHRQRLLEWASPNVPDRISQYRVVRLLASGGMGDVFEAEQDEPRRRVALKLMRQGLASTSALRRFQYESELLGRLRHPNIAQVHEAGTHQNGDYSVPFYAMEFISEARPITQYVRESNLELRARLELFASVCEAVGYAHQKGIIHRDLKPGNIMVDADGRVKVIDFGVARATGSEPHTTRNTHTGDLLGTLQYMSPEQTLGDPDQIDTRSDVYSLGVVLYEMLSDRHPYDLSGLNVIDAARVICEDRAPTLGTMDSKLRGELETIVEKCLDKDVDRRYASATALGEDTRRYLAGEAVLATRPSMAYKIRVFVRRHRTSSMVAATVTVLLAAILLIGVISHKRTQRSRLEALRVASMLSNLIDMVEPTHQGKTLPVRNLLDKVSSQIDDDVFAAHPELEASVRSSLGKRYEALAYLEEARANLEQAYELRKANLGDEHRDTMSAVNDLVNVLQVMDRLDEAEPLCRSTLSVATRVFGPDDPITLKTTSRLLAIVSQHGHPDEAVSMQRKMYERSCRVLGDEHPESLWELHKLACGLSAAGRHEEAEKLQGQIVDRRRRLLGADHLDTLLAMRYVAWEKCEQGKFEEAESVIREALDKTRSVAGPNHARTSDCLYVFGSVLLEKGDFSQAVDVFRQVLEVNRQRSGGLYEGPGFILLDIGKALRGNNELSEAETYLRKALARFESSQNRQGRIEAKKVGMAKSELGECLAKQGQFEKAEVLLLEGYHIQLPQRPHGHKHLRRAVKRLLKLYESMDRPDELEHWRRVLSDQGANQN